VIIPAANRRHLMLDEPVLAAVRDGRFHVWAIDSIDQGIEILTGLPAGERGTDGAYTAGTLHARVQERLTAMALSARKWGHAGADQPAGSISP